MTSGVDHVIVLAAGRGVRAGGPKALHRVGNELWWEVQQKRLSRVWLPVTWVVSERALTGMREGGGEPARHVLADEMAPMFTSVVAGMQAIDREALLDATTTPTAPSAVGGVFVLPVDVPAPRREVFVKLAGALADKPHAAASIPVHHGKHGHPVYVSWALVREKVLGVAQAADARLDRLIGRARVEVEVEDAGVVVNLNTAEEFEAWTRVEWRPK